MLYLLHLKFVKNCWCRHSWDPYPPSIGKHRQWGHPSPLKHADVLNGWSLSIVEKYLIQTILHRPIQCLTALRCSGHLLGGQLKGKPVLWNQHSFIEAALHCCKSFLFEKMRFILIASLILFLGIIGTNSANSTNSRQERLDKYY